MRTNRGFAWLSLSAVTLGLGILAGCQHNGSADFEAKSKAQQVEALKGSLSQMTPRRQKEMQAQVDAIMRSHAGQGGPGQAGQAGQAGAPAGKQ